jgi:hypothetical protein
MEQRVEALRMKLTIIVSFTIIGGIERFERRAIGAPVCGQGGDF